MKSENGGRASRPGKARRTPRQLRSKTTVDAIVVAASEILAGEGHRALTTNRIAAVAGIGIGSVYEYFIDKDAILAAVLANFSDSLWSDAERAFADAQKLGFEEALECVVHAVVTRYQSNPALHARLLEHTPYLKTENPLSQIEAHFVEHLSALLQSHQDVLQLSNPRFHAAVCTRSSRNLIENSCWDRSFVLNLSNVEPEMVAVTMGYLRCSVERRDVALVL